MFPKDGSLVAHLLVTGPVLIPTIILRHYVVIVTIIIENNNIATVDYFHLVP